MNQIKQFSIIICSLLLFCFTIFMSFYGFYNLNKDYIVVMVLVGTILLFSIFKLDKDKS